MNANQEPVPSPGCPPPHPAPRTPATALPPGSCDSHCHVFGPPDVFPYAPDRPFTPSPVPLASLIALHDHLGFDRAVIVQSTCHGADHSVLLDALDRGAGRFRGVALVDATTPRSEIARLHDAGVRGFRLHFLPHLGASARWDDIRDVVSRVADHGWHAEIHVHGEGIAEYAELIAALPIPAVVDHLARIELGSPGQDRATDALLGLLDTGRVWVKTSAVDRVSLAGPPYADAVALAARLVAHAPERVLWGTDFPHPNIRGAAPDDGLLVDLLSEIAPDPAVRHRLLVTNPAEFFEFS